MIDLTRGAGITLADLRGFAEENQAPPQIVRLEHMTIMTTQYLSIVVQGEQQKAFTRVGTRFGTSGPDLRWQVCMLGDTRMYIAGTTILLTKEDLYP